MGCSVDLGSQFCERCGRDRDTYPSARNLYRDCPECGAACCADCWNLVEGACLKCTPFRLTSATTQPRIVVPAAAATPAEVASAATDPYADLRAEAPQVDAWDASRSAARQRPKDAPPAGTIGAAAPDAWRSVVAAADPPPRARPRRRAGRIGLAATMAWVVVGALSVAVLGASPDGAAVIPAEAPGPSAPAPTIAPTARPTATPRATRKPRPTVKPRPVQPTQATPRPITPPKPRATPRPTARPTRPPKPVVVAPPTPRPQPTAAPTPVSPGAAPTP